MNSMGRGEGKEKPRDHESDRYQVPSRARDRFGLHPRSRSALRAWTDSRRTSRPDCLTDLRRCRMCVASCGEWGLLCVRDPGRGMVDGLGGLVDEGQDMKADKRLKPIGNDHSVSSARPTGAPGPLWPVRAHCWPNHRKPGASGPCGQGQRLLGTVPSAAVGWNSPDFVPLPRTAPPKGNVLGIGGLGDVTSHGISMFVGDYSMVWKGQLILFFQVSSHKTTAMTRGCPSGVNQDRHLAGHI